MKLKDFLRKKRIVLFNWQYWPWPVVYTPLLLRYFYNILRFPGPGFPTLVNRPFMEQGGILEESKLALYHKIPRGWTPRTIALPAFNDRESLSSFLDYHQLSFPLIIKPDRGMRGKGVRLHRKIESLMLHCAELDKERPHIIQPYADLPNEIGIFMVKQDVRWQITSLIKRELPEVTGNGSSCVEDLIRQRDHLFLHLERWAADPTIDMEYIPEAGESIHLGFIGNHRLGTNFRDRSDLITPELEMAMSRICDLLKGFEYGRLDIRYRHWQSFLELKDFSIIEVNGANSEPGHIYDHGQSLPDAWKVLLRHHQIIYKKAKKARSLGYAAPGFAKSVSLFRQYLGTMKLS